MTTGAGQPAPGGYGPAGAGGHEPANLGDILERVLDRGLVIVGDIRISLLDIELLTVKLRLLVASVETARQLGIDWWEHDPWLTSRRPALEDGRQPPEALTSGDAEPATAPPRETTQRRRTDRVE